MTQSIVVPNFFFQMWRLFFSERGNDGRAAALDRCRFRRAGHPTPARSARYSSLPDEPQTACEMCLCRAFCKIDRVRRRRKTKSSVRLRNDQHSTYEIIKSRVAYRWHPLHGKRVLVVRRVQVEAKEYAHIEGRDEFSHELPAWMLDAAICAPMELGSPLVSVAGLLELSQALQTDLVAVSTAVGARSGDEKHTRQTAPKSHPARSIRGRNHASTTTARSGRRDSQSAGRTAARRNAGKRKGAGE